MRSASLLFCFTLLLVAALCVSGSTALTCEDEPHCMEAAVRSSTMQHLMKLKEVEHAACQAAGSCPLQVPSTGSASCIDGKANNEYPCRDIDLQSFVSLGDLGSTGDASDIWGWTDPESKREYAIIGLEDGTSFVDVTEPTNPQVLAFLPSQTFDSLWRDIKVYKNHAYIGSEAFSHGLQVFDLTRLRGLSAQEPVTKLLADIHYKGFGSSHNIVINEESGFLYAVGSKKCKGGLYILDLNEDPKNPTYAGCFAQDGYVHDAQCVKYDGPDTRYTDHEICFNYDEDTLTIVDVTDKKNMKMLSRQGYRLSQYTHQGWLLSDKKHLLLNDELDEVESTELDGHTRTMVWNVEDLEKPELVNSYMNKEKSIDHNLYIVGDLAYLANYCSGLRIYDLSKAPDSIEEVAYFDVAPTCADTIFMGSWSVYPFFESGNIIVSSIERGLFVLRPSL